MTEPLTFSTMFLQITQWLEIYILSQESSAEDRWISDENVPGTQLHEVAGASGIKEKKSPPSDVLPVPMQARSVFRTHGKPSGYSRKPPGRAADHGGEAHSPAPAHALPVRTFPRGLLSPYLLL